MADKIEVGKAYVTIIPSMQGSQETITKELTGATDSAAMTAGEAAGSSLVQGIGGGMQKVGKGLSTYVTAPLVGLGTAAVGAFASVDQSMDIIVKKTGASGDALTDMQDRAKNIATTIPTNFESAASAIGELNTRFGLVGDDLETLATQFVEFADINGIDVSTSIDDTQKAMAALNVDIQDGSKFLDLLNAAGQNSGIDMGTLTNELVANAAALQQMGLSAEESVMFIANLDKSGIESATVLTGLKKALVSAAKEGKPMGEALAEVEDGILNAGSETEGLNKAMELFGNRAGPAMYNAIKNGSISLTDFSTSLGDVEGSVATTFQETVDPITQLKTVLNDLLVIGADLGSSLMGVLEPALATVADVIGKVSDWFTSLSPQTQDMIVKIALAAAALGPVIGLIGTIITTVSTLSSVMTFLTGPIGLVVAAIAAAIAIGVALYTHWDEVKAFLSETWETIKETATNVWNGIVSFFSATWEAIKNGAKAAWELVKSFIQNPIQTALSTVEKVVTTILEKMGFTGLADKVKGVFEKVKSFITSPIETARDTIRGVIDTIKGLFSFNISWPHIPLPHFAISPAGWKFGDLLKGSIPSLDIQWYAKAATEGAMFTKPTLIGVGDATQPELLIGRDTLREMIGDGITINVYGAPGQDVNALANAVAAKIQRQVEARKAGLG